MVESKLLKFIDKRRHRMNLLDAAIAHEGFFATYFFTVNDLDKSKDFCVRILGGKVIKLENPCYIKLANTWLIKKTQPIPSSNCSGPTLLLL
jgi:hypothetical protein